MNILGFVLINNRRNRYAIVDIEDRIKEVYLAGGREAAYAAYRAIKGVGITATWRAVKPLIKAWEVGSK